MDKLQVIQLAEEKGAKEGGTEHPEKGKARREAMEKLMIYARNLGCNIEAGGGRIGGINFRFGSIGYAIMDLSTEGDVKLYAQPHPNKTAPESLTNRINKFLGERDDLKMKSHPINCHGLLTQKVEDVPLSALIEFLEMALQAIKDTYYS